MTQEFVLDPEQVERLISDGQFVADEFRGVRISPFDVPRETAITDNGAGEVSVHFWYRDEELPGAPAVLETEVPPPVTITPGRYSGKIIEARLTLPGAESIRDVISALADRIARRGGQLLRVNQKLNYLLAAAILKDILRS